MECKIGSELYTMTSWECLHLPDINDFSSLKLECVLFFQDEGAVDVSPHHDEHEICFEYVGVAEGQFTSQEPGLHTENVDSLLIKQEVTTEQNCEMVFENVAAFSVTEEHPLIKEPGRCFENVATSDRKEYGTYFKIIDVRSIKEEPADEENVNEDPFAMGESQIFDMSSIKEQDIKQEERETRFMKTEEVNGGAVENLNIAANESAENVDGAQIKEEQFEMEENKSCISITENHFTAQDSRVCFMNVSPKEEQVIDDCLITTVMLKEEELGGTETNEVLR
jgi:hypothetical protein